MEILSTPKVGDIVYIDTAGHIDSSFRDVTGGKARIQSVEEKNGMYWVTLEGFETTSYNWTHLSAAQERLKKRFGDSWAHRGWSMLPSLTLGSDKIENNTRERAKLLGIQVSKSNRSIAILGDHLGKPPQQKAQEEENMSNEMGFIPEQCILWKKQDIGEEDVKMSNFDHLKTYIDQSHLWRYLLRCKECGQLYFFEFYEEVNCLGEGNGNDYQYSTWIPVAPDSEKLLNEKSPLELLGCFPRIQSDMTPYRASPAHWVEKSEGR